MGEMLRRTREERERLKHKMLAPSATKADESRGRTEPEEPDEFRTSFERDRDRIVHSKVFRRLKHKTQVFLNPDGDHYVTRMTHTIHVTQVGRAMATALGLNEDLTEAICLAHDVGHSPFRPSREKHVAAHRRRVAALGARRQDSRIARTAEPESRGLDGVRAHSWRIDPPPETPEGWLCRFADRIAYLTHDVSDALRAGVSTTTTCRCGP